MSTIGPGTTHRTTPDPLTPHRVPGQRRVWRWVVGSIAALTLLGSATAAGMYWASRSGTPEPGGEPTSAASATTTSAPTVTSTAAAPAPTTASASTSAPAAVRAVPVYYVADVAGGPRLYREFHSLPLVNGSPALTAVTEMLRGTPVDKDYSSPWPTTVTVRSLTVSGDLATVDLSGFVSVGASYEAASVQQLVYTVTAADPGISRVKLLVNGSVPPSGHIDWSKPVTRANALDTLAFVWILAPEQGATVSSPVTVTVYGTGWEGNVPLKVYQGQAVVASTHVTTMMGGFAEAHTTIQLSPGTYELRAYNDNGRDSSLQLWDSKTFTVR
ncbi:MAG TPA: GerMN domain-containing protein [Propionibacteriaceae bacterium]|nr:GerMN domain-containing protein [Propionibacteriaceae bacterium]